MSRAVRRYELVIWFAALFATYLALISSISVTELIVDAAASCAGAVAAVATRRALLAADNPESYRPRARWAAWALPVPVQIFRDTLLLARPRLPGRMSELTLPGPDERAAAQRGFATLAVSTSPGSYVLRVDPDRNVLLIHRIAGRPSAIERKISARE